VVYHCRSDEVGLGRGGYRLPFHVAGASAVGFVSGFLIYFPLHAWLTISLFLVLFSSFERERLLGGGYSAFGGFFARLFSPYGLFCIGWFYALMGLGVLSATVD
jgi:hypothetical protein